MNTALLYFAFFALWGLALTGTGHWAKNPMWTVCGLTVFLINTLQFAYWYRELLP